MELANKIDNSCLLIDTLETSIRGCMHCYYFSL